MSHVEVNHTPTGLKVVKHEEKLAILKYNSVIKRSTLFSYLIYTPLTIAFLMFLLLVNFPDIQLITPMNLIINIIISLVILGYVSSNSWTKITIKPDLIIIDSNSYNIQHAELRSSNEHKKFEIYLQYGADVHILQPCLKDSLAIVNYINPIIISIGTGNSNSNNSDKGERVQIFE
jgi:hypothetical protein